MSDSNSMGRDLRKELLRGKPKIKARTAAEQTAAVDEMARRHELGLNLYTGLPLEGADLRAWEKLKEEEARQLRKPARKPRVSATPNLPAMPPAEVLPSVMADVYCCFACESNLCGNACIGANI